MPSISDIYATNSDSAYGYGIVNYGTALAKNALNAGYSSAASSIKDYANAGASNLTDAYQRAIATVAPQTSASYSLLDQLLDSLGVSRPSSGSSQYALDVQNLNLGYQNKVNDLNKQLSDLNANKASIEQGIAFETNQAKKGGHTKEVATKLLNQYNANLNQVKSQIEGINNQLLAARLDFQNKQQQFQFTNPDDQQQKVIDTLRNQPGYQFAANEGVRQLQSKAASAGLLRSGKTLKAVEQYSTNLADQTYNNYVNQLQTALNQQNQFTAGTAQLQSNLGNAQYQGALSTGGTLGGLQAQQGTDLGNLYAAQASALSNIYQSARLMNQSQGLAGQYASAYQAGYMGGK